MLNINAVSNKRLLIHGTSERIATLQEISNTLTESMTPLNLMKMEPLLMMIIVNVKEFQNLKLPLMFHTYLKISHQQNLTHLNQSLLMIMFLNLNQSLMLLPLPKYLNLNM